jgi:hypothetical protein
VYLVPLPLLRSIPHDALWTNANFALGDQEGAPGFVVESGRTLNSLPSRTRTSATFVRNPPAIVRPSGDQAGFSPR